MIGTIVIPVLNEAPTIAPAMAQLLSIAGDQWQVVLVDGGSQDGTMQQVQHLPLLTVSSAAGRAQQMNRGAELAAGELILFLHADTQLPADFSSLLMRDFFNSDHQWGRFDVELDDARWPYRMIGWFINHRSALTGVCTGDQAFFVRRRFFRELGGFADLPLMEDIEFSLRARRWSRPLRVRDTVRTSARRWSRNGVLKTILLMWWLRLAYRLGVSPVTLHRWYYG